MSDHDPRLEPTGDGEATGEVDAINAGSAEAVVANRPQGGTETERRAWPSRAATVAWLVAVGAFALFLAVGSVTLESGFRGAPQARLRSEAEQVVRPGNSVRVTEVWGRFVADLPDVGYAALLRIAVLAAFAVVALGGAAGLWLALAAADPDAGPAVDAGSS